MLLRLHRRHQYIKRIFNQIRKIRGPRQIHVEVMLDRPSASVIAELNNQTRQLPNRISHAVLPSPRPIMSVDGEQWMSNLQVHHASLLANFDAQAIIVWDDDWLFTHDGLGELHGHLISLSYDRYEALSIFHWDSPTEYNATMLSHWSAILYRVYPGDEYALNFINHSPRACARSKVSTRLIWPLRNFGYMTEDDRVDAWDRSKAAGRVDAFTMNFKKQWVKTKTWTPESWTARYWDTLVASSTAKGASPPSGPPSNQSLAPPAVSS